MKRLHKILVRLKDALMGAAGVSHDSVAATTTLPPDAKIHSPKAETEMVSVFDIEGVHFQLLWKPGLCLLRTTESYGTPDARTYTAVDLFVQLYDGSPNYELSKEDAIFKAPFIAQKLIREQRQQEIQHMESLYTSAEMQKDYPVYNVWQQDVQGVSYPVVWASHNCGLYMRMIGRWHVAGFAQSRAEAEAKLPEAIAAQLNG